MATERAAQVGAPGMSRPVSPTRRSCRREELFALPLRVVISHKQGDVSAAGRIREQLQKVGGNKVDVLLAGEDNVLKGAEDWRPAIPDTLRKAHVLIVLYSDPSQRWDWSLYETRDLGAAHDLGRRRYVLHRWDVRPAVSLLGVTPIPIEAPDDPDDRKLRSMLKTLFADSTKEPVNGDWDLGGCVDLVRVFKEPFVGATRHRPTSSAG